MVRIKKYEGSRKDMVKKQNSKVKSQKGEKGL